MVHILWNCFRFQVTELSRNCIDRAMNFTRIENFDLLSKPGKSTDKALIILHGFGASAADLAPLSGVFPEFHDYTWYFIEGPVQVPLGMGVMGKAWFPLDMEAMQRALMAGNSEYYFKNTPPPGMAEMVTKLIPLVENIAKNHHEIILGGFSQGSMIASHLYPFVQKQVQKLLLLSSTLADVETLSKNYKDADPVAVYQSHGASDPVLSIKGAMALKEFYEERNIDHKFHQFSGAHEIPIQVLEDAKSFLKK